MWRWFLWGLAFVADGLAVVLVYLEVRRWLRRRRLAGLYKPLPQDEDPVTRVPLEVRHLFAEAAKSGKALRPDNEPWKHGRHGGPDGGS